MMVTNHCSSKRILVSTLKSSLPLYFVDVAGTIMEHNHMLEFGKITFLDVPMDVSTLKYVWN